MTDFAHFVIDLASRMGHWGYFVIFVIVLLECQAGLGFFMPGETVVLTGGFLAGQHVFDLDALITTVALAAVAGDSLGYELGRRLRRDWLENHGRRFGVTKPRLDKADAFVRQHGGKGAFFSHFSHYLRPLMPFLAGSQHMRYLRFFTFNAAGCLLWACVVALLGFFFGAQWQLLEKWVGRAGFFAGPFVLLVIGGIWLWHWVSRNEDALYVRWRSFLERPSVAAFRRRYARQIEFLQDRLTPGGYLGLHLTIGAAVILLASWWFGGIAEDLLNHDPLVVVDQRIAFWFHQHATPGLTRIVQGITFFGSPELVASVATAVALFFLARRSWYRLFAVVLAMVGGGLLDTGLKVLFARPRPVFVHPIVVAHGFSFPSGHTMGATLLYGFLALAVARAAQTWRWRVLVVIIACWIILLVGFSRLYLGAHFLSDVMGGMAAGIAWLAFSLTAVSTLRRRNFGK